tara:strand:+ start:425 stop:688 length:264 start_codon:yes stop_codon:yes gene_type:complete
VLDGFYQSEVLVAAVNKEDAIQTALQAYDAWVAYNIEEYGYHRLISEGYPDDEGHDQESKAKRQEFHEELKTSLAQTVRRGLILVSS